MSLKSYVVFTNRTVKLSVPRDSLGVSVRTIGELAVAFTPGDG